MSDDDDDKATMVEVVPVIQYLAVEIKTQIADEITAELNTYGAQGWTLVTGFGRPGGSVVYVFRQ